MSNGVAAYPDVLSNVDMPGSSSAPAAAAGSRLNITVCDPVKQDQGINAYITYKVGPRFCSPLLLVVVEVGWKNCWYDTMSSHSRASHDDSGFRMIDCWLPRTRSTSSLTPARLWLGPQPLVAAYCCLERDACVCTNVNATPATMYRVELASIFPPLRSILTPWASL